MQTSFYVVYEARMITNQPTNRPTDQLNSQPTSSLRNYIMGTFGYLLISSVRTLPFKKTNLLKGDK